MPGFAVPPVTRARPSLMRKQAHRRGSSADASCTATAVRGGGTRPRDDSSAINNDHVGRAGVLAGLCTAFMLVYLPGDVIRVFAGTSSPVGCKPSRGPVPVVGRCLGLARADQQDRAVSDAAATADPVGDHPGIGVPGVVQPGRASLPGRQANVLIAVSFVVNGLIICQAWIWTP